MPTMPPQCQGPDPRPARPRASLPAGAVDCHCHVYGDPGRYRLAPVRSYTPVVASLQDYLAMCRQVGLARTVQVNASVYGFDNSVTQDVIRELGQDRARGIAGLAPDTPAAEIERLHEAGFRGVRLSTHVKGYGGVEAVGALAPRLRPFGWHVQLHLLRVQELADLERELMALPVPVVFDHLGGARGAEGPQCAGFQALLRLLRNRDDAWVKISSWYRRSDAGKPGHADMKPLVQAVVDARPDRAVFGTNWPHPSLFDPADVPNDGALVDQFCDWVPDEAARTRILVDNPARLYGFD